MTIGMKVWKHTEASAFRKWIKERDSQFTDAVFNLLM